MFVFGSHSDSVLLNGLGGGGGKSMGCRGIYPSLFLFGKKINFRGTEEGLSRDGYKISNLGSIPGHS